MANCAETTITLTDAPDDGERAVIMDGLRAYNEAQAGGSDALPLAILVRDPETTKVAGGLLGRTYLGLLTVERFHARGGDRFPAMLECISSVRSTRASSAASRHPNGRRPSKLRP